MAIGAEDFEFCTFFLGLKQKELACLEELLQSFPHYDTHKINIVDQSQAVRAELESGSVKFYYEWRNYEIEPERTLDYTECEQLFSQYAHVVNRIVEPKKLFHGQAIDKVMNHYSHSPFVVIMDSDIVFTSDRYLPDMMSLCNRYSYDELAAIGMLYQKTPFRLTLSPEVDNSFYQIFLTAQYRHIPLKYVMMTAAKHLLKRAVKAKRVNSLSRFPRLHPALLLINRQIFIDYEMTFRNLYLDVLDILERYETKHRIFGDNGSSFLYQCSLAGKRIISIDLEEYVSHRSRVAISDKKAKGGWNWSSAPSGDDPLQ